MIGSIENIEQKLLVILAGDVATSIVRQTAAPTQQNNRSLVRTAFAAFEGVISIFRDHITGIAADLGELSPAEVAALAESLVQISETGKISTQSRFVPLLPMFRFLTRISMRLDPRLVINFADGNWEKVRTALQVRNRIMHPKAASDLSVSPDDVTVCMDAFYWLLEQTVNAMASANAAFAMHVAQFSEILEALKAGDPEMIEAYEAAGKILED